MNQACDRCGSRGPGRPARRSSEMVAGHPHYGVLFFLDIAAFFVVIAA
jgi:hypothetical protein